MSEIVERIKKQLEDFDVKKKKLVEELRKEFPALLKELFDKSELIESVGWTQYTPFFNDGETCEFGVNISDLYVNGEYEGDVDWLEESVYKTITEDNLAEHKEFNNTPLGYKHYIDYKVGQQGLFKNPGLNEKEHSILNEFKEILNSIPEDFYKDLFGDHCQVTITKEGTIEIEEYEHE